MAALEAINHELRPPDRPDSASEFADTWQATHAFAPTSIRTIINTSALPDHIGGNAKIRNSKEFNPLGVLGEEEQGSEVILAQEATAKRMGEMGIADDGIPTNTYFSLHYNMHRFFNNQAVQVTHMANAISDGDSIVFFRKSDVIATGDIYIADQYPPIDVEKGGSINGEITALNNIFDMCVTEFMAQGGTVIIPGHGFLSDAADLGYYRDALTVIRERIQKMVDAKMTLAQVQAAKPTMDYDPEYGREAGGTGKFVEGVSQEPDRERRVSRASRSLEGNLNDSYEKACSPGSGRVARYWRFRLHSAAQRTRRSRWPASRPGKSIRA